MARRRLIGKVVSNKMTKTVTVEIENSMRHALYGKVIKITRRFMAHDENNACQIGDMVPSCFKRYVSSLSNDSFVLLALTRRYCCSASTTTRSFAS